MRKPPADGVQDNEFLFRASTIIRRANERLQEEKARMAADILEFNARLPEIDSRGSHIPGDVGRRAHEYMRPYTLGPEHVESKDREMLSDLGLRGEDLDKALGI